MKAVNNAIDENRQLEFFAFINIRDATSDSRDTTC